MSSSEGYRPTRFHWSAAREQLLDFGAAFPAAVGDESGYRFVDPGGRGRLELPLLLPKVCQGGRIADYEAELPDQLGRQVLILMRAGAASVGYWDEDELVRHKAFKRYVVRGKGRAQPTHLATKGKSRYGSRLRLQNWQRLLTEVAERLSDWWDELGAPEQVLYAAPVRIMPELFAAGLPFERDDPSLRRIPIHVHEPDHRELLRVHQALTRGCLELAAD